MEIAGYNVPTKYAIAGGLGIVVVGYALSQRKSTDAEQVATIKPAEGLTWQDIFKPADLGKLIGPGGATGLPGESGPPGLPGGDGNGGSGGPIVIPDPIGAFPPPEPGPLPGVPPPPEPGPEPGPGITKPPKTHTPGRGACSANEDCRKGQHCRHGRCVDKGDNQHEKDGNRGDRPRMPDHRADTLPVPDPRLDTPKDRQRKGDGNNRLGNDNRDNRRDTLGNNDREGDRRNADARGGRVVSKNPLSGNLKIDVSGGRERDRGRNANADARGGTVRLGDVNDNTRGSIDANGGTAIAIGNRGKPRHNHANQEDRDQQRADRGERHNDTPSTLPTVAASGGIVTTLPIVPTPAPAAPDQVQPRYANNPYEVLNTPEQTVIYTSVRRENESKGKHKGKAGYGAVPGLDSNGLGRNDGQGGTAEGFVRTNPSPGTTSGGFMATPQALGRRSEAILLGETLKGLSRRQHGIDGYWPRIAVLNEDLEVPRGEIPAGTVFRT